MKVKSKINFSKEDMDAFKRVHDIVEKLADTSLNDEEEFVSRDGRSDYEDDIDELMLAFSNFVKCSSFFFHK